MSTLTLKELSAPTGEVIKIASGKTLDLNSQGTLILPTVPSAKMPTGSVLQVLQASSDTQLTTSNTGMTDTGHSITITPRSTASKVLATCSFNAQLTNSNGLQYVLYRGSTQIGDIGIAYQSGATNTHFPVTQSVLDSPSSASAVVYKLYIRANGSGSVRLAADWGHVLMTAMEIQG